MRDSKYWTIEISPGLKRGKESRPHLFLTTSDNLVKILLPAVSDESIST